MRPLAQAAAVILLTAPTLTALPLRPLPRPQLCRASTAGSACAPGIQLLLPRAVALAASPRART